MTINIKVVPNARRERMVQESGRYKVYVNAPAEGGRANARMVDILSEHFGVKRREVRIIRGETARQKVVEILSASPSIPLQGGGKTNPKFKP